MLQERIKCQLYLFQVFHIEQDMQRAEALANKHVRLCRNCQQSLVHQHPQRAETAAAENEEAAATARVEALRKQLQTMTKQRTVVEREISKAKAGVDKHNPAAVRVREEVARLKRKLKSEEKNAANKRVELEEQQGKLAQLCEELQRVQSAAASHEKDAAAQAAKAGRLSPAALDEYNDLKAKAGAQSSRLLTDRSAAQSALQADRQALANVEEALAAMDARMDALGARFCVVDHSGTVCMYAACCSLTAIVSCTLSYSSSYSLLYIVKPSQARRWRRWRLKRRRCKPVQSRTGLMPSRQLLTKPTSRGSYAAAGALLLRLVV